MICDGVKDIALAGVMEAEQHLNLRSAVHVTSSAAGAVGIYLVFESVANSSQSGASGLQKDSPRLEKMADGDICQ